MGGDWAVTYRNRARAYVEIDLIAFTEAIDKYHGGCEVVRFVMEIGKKGVYTASGHLGRALFMLLSPAGFAAFEACM